VKQGLAKNAPFLCARQMALTLPLIPLWREIDVAVSASGQHDRMGGVAFHLTRDQVPDGDSARLIVHDHQVHHFTAGKHLDFPCMDLSHHGMVSAQEQLLTGLAPRIKGSGHLGSTEGAVGEKAAVLSCKGHALGHTQVDDLIADLRQAVDIGLAGRKSPPLTVS